MASFTESERARLHAEWCSAPRKQSFEEFAYAALLGLEVGLRRQGVDLQGLSQLISSIHSSAHEADRLLHPEHHGEKS